MTIKFDNINDLFAYENKCPQCKKPLKKLIATGKHEDIINFGHKTKVVDFVSTKKELKVTRSFKVEDFNISADYIFNAKDNTMRVEFTPSIDEIVERFPIVQGFYDLPEDRYAIAQAIGIINIWGIVHRTQNPFFAIQECEFHYRRVSGIFFDELGEKIEDIESWDDFLYTPTMKVPDQYYVVHTHTAPKTKKKSMSIHISKKEMVDNLDPQRGYVLLRDPQDAMLMKFDTLDAQKFARRLSTICALKG